MNPTVRALLDALELIASGDPDGRLIARRALEAYASRKPLNPHDGGHGERLADIIDRSVHEYAMTMRDNSKETAAAMDRELFGAPGARHS